MTQEGVQARGPCAREREGIATQERMEKERSVEDPCRLAEALEVKRAGVGEIERDERKDRGGRDRQSEGRSPEDAQHGGIMPRMSWIRGERPDQNRE